MISFRLPSFTVVLALIGATESSDASAIYTYTGETYTDIIDSPLIDGTYTTSMSVNGSFTLASPLAPDLVGFDLLGSLLNFSFTDGRSPALTPSNTNQILFFDVGTDSAGNIIQWSIGLLETANAEFSAGEERNSIFTHNIIATVFDSAGIELCVEGDPCITVLLDVGRVLNSAGTWTPSLSPVPEPATLGLLGLGLAGTALATTTRCRRRR